MGLKGLVCGDELPKERDIFPDGRIGYTGRRGVHKLSLDDFNNYMYL